MASNDILTGEPPDDITADCSSVVTPSPLPLSDTAMRATAHSVSFARRPRMTFRSGPRLPSRQHTVCRRVPQRAASRGRDISGIRESTFCQPILAVVTRGGDATTAVVHWIIIAAGLRLDSLVDARTAPPGTPDVANRRRGVRRRATRGALARIITVARHMAPLCGWVCRRVSSLHIDQVPSVCVI